MNINAQTSFNNAEGSGFEKWKLLKCDCPNMHSECFDRNSPQMNTAQKMTTGKLLFKLW